MEYIPSFKDSLHVDIQPSYLSHVMTQDEFDAKKFGLPRSKKYPMPDAAHVRSAIKFFNYVTPANEKELAKNILARMDEYGIDPDSLNVGDINRFKKYIKPTVLKHHGIKGMHWGVRRYQNPDGSLTPEGRKRYYRPDGMLSKEGTEYNKRARTNLRSYRDATLYNTRKTDPNFAKMEKRYAELRKAGSDAYEKDFDNFLKGRDFKDLDYEDFKDASYSRFLKTDLGKERSRLATDMRKALDEIAREHPFYSKNYKQLRTFNSEVYAQNRNLPLNDMYNDSESINYGKQVVNELMNSIIYGTDLSDH